MGQIRIILLRHKYPNLDIRMLWHMTLQFTVAVSVSGRLDPHPNAPDLFSIHNGCAVSVYSRHPNELRLKHTCGACDKYQPMSATSVSSTHPSLCLVGTLPSSQSLDWIECTLWRASWFKFCRNSQSFDWNECECIDSGFQTKFPEFLLKTSMSASSSGETGLLKSVESISNIIYGPLLVISPALFPEQISHIGALGRCWAPIKTFWADVARQEIAPSTPQTSTQGQKQVHRVPNKYTGSQTAMQGHNVRLFQLEREICWYGSWCGWYEDSLTQLRKCCADRQWPLVCFAEF